MFMSPGFFDKYEKPIKYIAAGLFILIAIGYGLIYLNYAPTATEPFWTRFTGLLPIIEALLFASAGFVFGKEVHREQAEKADQRADSENSRATDAISNGRALKSRIECFASQYEPQKMDTQYRLFSLEGSTPQAPLVKSNMENDLNELLRMQINISPDESERTVYERASLESGKVPQ
jgi:hypothetical protein